MPISLLIVEACPMPIAFSDVHPFLKLGLTDRLAARD
jgi:hypothetical protein